MRTNRIEPKRGTGRMAALLLLAAVAACSGDAPLAPGNGNPQPTPVAAVVVTPEVIALQLHETRQISATPQAADRTPLTDRSVTWTTSDSTVAVVTRNGTVLAQGVGTVTLTATSEGKQGHARVEVSPLSPSVAVVVVTPEVISLQIDETRQISATPQAADRTPLTDRVVTWTTSDSAVAFVTQYGTVLARGVGTATLTATSEGKQGHARVEVSLPPPPPSVAYVVVSPGDVTMSGDPATWKLSAKTYGSDGRELDGRTVTWSSSDTTVVNVYDGRLVARGTGTAYVIATSEGKQARVKVTVPEWEKDRVLKSAAGLPLPALIGTSTYVDDKGVTHTVRRVVTDGALRFGFLDDRYEQRLMVQTYQDGVWVGTERYFDRGTYTYNWLDGTLSFTSTLFANHRFTAGPTHDGGLAVTQRISEEDTPAIFVFGKS